MMTPKRPDEARKAVVDALRRTKRKSVSYRRSLLVGCAAVVAAVGGLVLPSALVANARSGGVVVQERPILVSYHRQANPIVTASTNQDVHFAITGDASQVLYPGKTSSIDLAFTNKTGTAITLPAGAIAITMSSQRPTKCPTAPNFTVVQTLTSAIAIPDGVTGESLSNMGITTGDWPVISMVTTHVTQDGCAGMTLTLHYSASVVTTGSVTKGTTGTGSGSGSQSGGSSSSGSSSVPVETSTASSGALAFTGLDAALLVGLGGLLLLAGAGLLVWSRRAGARH